MCQPGHLALPNGLLNADIKPALPSSLPSCLPQFPPTTPTPALPRSALITSPSHPVPHPVTHLSSPSLSPSPCRSVDQTPSPAPNSPFLPPSPSLDSFEPFPRLLIPEAFFPLFKAFFSLLFFPQINELDVSPFLGVSSPPFSADRLHNAFYPQDPSFTLTLLHVLTAPLHGLANAFVFSLDGDWRSVLSPSGMQVRPSRTFF